MKIPDKINTYCPKCRQYTEHSVSLLKTGRRRKMAAGERHHEQVDRHGYGGQKAPLAKPVKTTKKQTLKLKCSKCSYTIQKRGIRIKKLEVAR